MYSPLVIGLRSTSIGPTETSRSLPSRSQPKTWSFHPRASGNWPSSASRSARPSVTVVGPTATREGSAWSRSCWASQTRASEDQCGVAKPGGGSVSADWTSMYSRVSACIASCSMHICAPGRDGGRTVSAVRMEEERTATHEEHSPEAAAELAASGVDVVVDAQDALAHAVAEAEDLVERGPVCRRGRGGAGQRCPARTSQDAGPRRTHPRLSRARSSAGGSRSGRRRWGRCRAQRCPTSATEEVASVRRTTRRETRAADGP